MRRLLFRGLVIGLFLFGFVVMANASLIGDSVTATHFSPDLSPTSGGSPQTTYVVVGTSDLMYPISASTYTVNVEEDEIKVLFYTPDWAPTRYWSHSTFNGLVVDSLNDSSGYPLNAVTINTNFVSWNDSRAWFDADTVYFNWENLSYNSSTYFNATLEFSPVPIPGAVWLLGSGLIGVVGIRRKLNNQ